MHQPTLESVTTTLPGNLGDPALATWILSWESHALASEPLRFFEGNFFYPFGEAIKYSELMLPMVPVFGVVLAISGSPLLAHNLLLLALSLFTLIATYLLARRLINELPAVIAAISFTFSSFVFAHQTHLPMLALGFFPLAFLWLFRLLERRRVADGICLGVVTFLLATASLYYGAVWLVCMTSIVVWDWARLRNPDPAWWKSLGSAAATAGLLLAPFGYVYAEFQSRVSWTRDSSPNVLHAVDFLTPAPQSLLYEPMFHSANARSTTGLVEHGFFLGFAVILLSVVGLVALLSRWRASDQEGATSRTYEIGLLSFAGLMALLLSLGPEVAGIPMPFAALREVVGFNSVRAVSRLAVPFLLALAVLAALGLSRLIVRCSQLRRGLIVGLVSVVILCEMWVEPIRAPVDEPDLVLSVLAAAPPGPVIELPMREVPDSEFAYLEGPRLLASIGDWRPRFNGYSGGFPPGYVESIATIMEFPDPVSLDQIRSLGLRYVVLHGGSDEESRGAYPTSQIGSILAELPESVSVQRVDSDWLVDLGASVVPNEGND